MPAFRDIHEAANYVFVLKKSSACDASRMWRLESEQPHRVVVLEGLACGVVRWRSRVPSGIKETMLVRVHAYILKGARPGALRSRTRGWLRLYSRPSLFLSRKWGVAAPTSPLSAALGLSRMRLAIAGNKMIGRLGLSCIRLATAGNEALGKWGLPSPHPRSPQRSACLAYGSLPRATKRLASGGCRPHIPALRCARLVLQTARYHGQRSAWQMGAAAA
jgi:hypothetical protein